jgi:osmotically-inducible protein OsmY
MKVGHKKKIGATCACIVPLVCGLGGFTPRAIAQTVASGVTTRSTAGGPSASEGAAARDAKLRQRVAAALHAQPYFDDQHIHVSIRGGVVVLSGIVFSDWDLQDALRTARKAAGGRRVVDSLSIEEGGR